jgi:hypothetical protein
MRAVPQMDVSRWKKAFVLVHLGRWLSSGLGQAVLGPRVLRPPARAGRTAPPSSRSRCWAAEETGSPCSSPRTTAPLWMLVSLLRPLFSRTPYHPLQHLNPLAHRTMSAVIRDQATASFKLVRRPRLDALAL